MAFTSSAIWPMAGIGRIIYLPTDQSIGPENVNGICQFRPHNNVMKTSSSQLTVHVHWAYNFGSNTTGSSDELIYEFDIKSSIVGSSLLSSTLTRTISAGDKTGTGELSETFTLDVATHPLLQNIGNSSDYRIVVVRNKSTAQYLDGDDTDLDRTILIGIRHIELVFDADKTAAT